MKRAHHFFIALSYILIGFALSSFYSKSAAPAPMPAAVSVSPVTQLMRVVKGTRAPSNYYINLIGYGPDSNTVNLLDTFNTKLGLTITSSGSLYLLTAQHGNIDSVPRSVFLQNYITLIDSTIYSRYGIIYGKDADGKPHSFSSNDIVSIQGNIGSITVGTMALEGYE